MSKYQAEALNLTLRRSPGQTFNYLCNNNPKLNLIAQKDAAEYIKLDNLSKSAYNASGVSTGALFGLLANRCSFGSPVAGGIVLCFMTVLGFEIGKFGMLKSDLVTNSKKRMFLIQEKYHHVLNNPNTIPKLQQTLKDSERFL